MLDKESFTGSLLVTMMRAGHCCWALANVGPHQKSSFFAAASLQTTEQRHHS